MIDKKLCIIGTGGFARDVLFAYLEIIKHDYSIPVKNVVFMVSRKYITLNEVMGVPVIALEDFDVSKYVVVVAIADPHIRKAIVENLPNETIFSTLIHPSVILSPWVKIGTGSIILAGSIITCNIAIGNHTHINLLTTIGHDCEIKDYFTSSPGVKVGGNCIIGECVFIGSNACIREKLSITSDVTIGMGAVVVKNITESGVYIGNPLKKLNK
jgi:sugar O-acyltransferase (sialic acid O-acetyltransferase NeuD family)